MERTVVDYYKNKGKHHNWDWVKYALLAIVMLGIGVFAYIRIFGVNEMDRYNKAYEKSLGLADDEIHYSVSERATYHDSISSREMLDYQLNVTKTASRNCLVLNYVDSHDRDGEYTIYRRNSRYLLEIYRDSTEYLYVSENQPQLFTDAYGIYERMMPLYPDPDYILPGTLDIDYSGYSKCEINPEMFSQKFMDDVAEKCLGAQTGDIYYVDSVRCYFEIEDGIISYYNYFFDLTGGDSNVYGNYYVSYYRSDYMPYISEYSWTEAEPVEDLDAVYQAIMQAPEYDDQLPEEE